MVRRRAITLRLVIIDFRRVSRILRKRSVTIFDYAMYGKYDFCFVELTFQITFRQLKKISGMGIYRGEKNYIEGHIKKQPTAYVSCLKQSSGCLKSFETRLLRKNGHFISEYRICVRCSKLNKKDGGGYDDYPVGVSFC